jgi:hypothetical protein
VDCSLLIKLINLKYNLSQLKHTLQKIKYRYFYKEGIKDNVNEDTLLKTNKIKCGEFIKDNTEYNVCFKAYR